MKTKIISVVWLVAALAIGALCLVPPRVGWRLIAMTGPRLAEPGGFGPVWRMVAAEPVMSLVVYRPDWPMLGLMVGALVTAAAAVTLGSWFFCRD